MQDSIDLKRMYWHSRRGMLELDLILVPFAEKVLPELSVAQKKSYAKLLLEEDQDLFQWLVRKTPATRPELQKAVEMVLAGKEVKS